VEKVQEGSKKRREGKRSAVFLEVKILRGGSSLDQRRTAGRKSWKKGGKVRRLQRGLFL